MLRGGLLILILAVLAAPPRAGAQTLADYDYEELAFRGVGADWGRVWPAKVKPAAAYGLRVDLGYLGPGVRVVPSLTYWSSELEEDELERWAEQLRGLGVEVGEEGLGPIEWSDLALSVDGHFVWTTPVGLLPYVGAGVALHALNGTGRAIEGTFVEDLLDSVTGGAAVLAGLEYEPVARLRLYGEARYVLVSDVAHAGVRVGGAFFLPARPDVVGLSRGPRGAR